MLARVAPGTSVRHALDDLLRAGIGTLLVFAEHREVFRLIDAAVRVEEEATSARLYELAKMDGAIVLTKDGSRVTCANAYLTPPSSIFSTEAGMRHRTANRVAVHTGSLCVALSQVRRTITLYQGPERYVLRQPENVLGRAQYLLNGLIRHRNRMRAALADLSRLEARDSVTLSQVTETLSVWQALLRSLGLLWLDCAELGREGQSLAWEAREAVNELVAGGWLVFCDYSSSDELGVLKESARDLVGDYPEAALLDREEIAEVLGYDRSELRDERHFRPRGFRHAVEELGLQPSAVAQLTMGIGSLEEVVERKPRELARIGGLLDEEQAMRFQRLLASVSPDAVRRS